MRSTSLVLALASTVSMFGCSRSNNDRPVVSEKPAESTPTTTAAPITGGSAVTDYDRAPSPANTTGNPSNLVVTPSAEVPQAAQGMDQRADLSDAQILGITGAADQGEIDMAKLAVRKAKDPAVKQFAQEMITAHTKMSQQGRTLASKIGIGPEESTQSQTIKDMGNDTMKRLQALEGAAFDKAYMDSQVTAHTQVLATFDNQLIASAANPDLKRMLTDGRGQVAMHLEHARTVQGKLAGGMQTGGQGTMDSSGGTMNNAPMDHGPGTGTGTDNGTGSGSGSTGGGSTGQDTTRPRP